MRCDIGRHTDRNTARSVYKQVRETGRENRRFLFLTVIVVLHVDGIFFKIT